MESEKILEELLTENTAARLPEKKIQMLKRLQERITAGHGLSEMQEELLLDLGKEYDIAS